MKSRYPPLQCPCGCELQSTNRVELLYCALIESGMTVTAGANCKVEHSQHLLLAVLPLDPVNKLKRRLGWIQHKVDFNFLCIIDEDAKIMQFNVSLGKAIQHAEPSTVH